MELVTPVEKIFKLNTETKKGLKKIGIQTVKDLLYYFPVRYSHISEISNIEGAKKDVLVTLYGVIKKMDLKKSFKTKKYMVTGEMIDVSGNSINLLWFNQHYIAKMYTVGQSIHITGKITVEKNKKIIINGEISAIKELPIDSHESLFKGDSKDYVFGYPIYKETKGVTSKWLYHAIKKLLSQKVAESIHDSLGEEILKKYRLPKLSSALHYIHLPQNENHASAAKKRFAFEEIYTLQIARQYDKLVLSKEKAYQVNYNHKKVKEFLDQFPFEKTNAQLKAVEVIAKDLEKSSPMSRLLEGDVGSGKTLVAAATCFGAITSRPKSQNFGTLQAAYMAPTEILATQHFENFIHYFKDLGIQIALITSSGCRKFPSKVATKNNAPTWTTISKNQLLKWVANGEISIVIGTHALIQKAIIFKHLALVIIDEQHRFGAKQRALLAKKDGFLPHFLSMSATPIPRTLALTLYGDLDLTILNELPKGRKSVVTTILYKEERDQVYKKIKEEIKKGHQAYIICSKIDSDEENTTGVRSVTQEASRLKKNIFPEYTIDILHSKMTKDKKESVMQKFYDGQTNILVATSVIEVGVNVPNATIIVIEGGERFGLSQLHQLRGRVQRSSDQSYCFIFSENKTEKTKERLQYFLKARDGFELAEYDLTLRGTGELAGNKQSGISDIGMEAIKNIKLVEAARTEAIEYVKRNNLIEIRKEYHFE